MSFAKRFYRWRHSAAVLNLFVSHLVAKYMDHPPWMPVTPASYRKYVQK